MILDTSFVEDVTGENDDALAKADSLVETGTPERLSAMTLYELYWGIGYVEQPQAEREVIDAVLETKEVYHVTPEIARKAGRLAGTLASDGQPLDDPGGEIIGATGIVHDEPVLTRNVEHFDRVPGLEVESY